MYGSLKGNTEGLVERPVPEPFCLQQAHMDWLRSNPGLGERPAGNLLSPGPWHNFLSHLKTSFPTGAAAPTGQGLFHYGGFTITLRHTTLGRTPLEE
jgi:hypothetical protein